MTLSKVVSFLSGSNPPVISPATAPRVREASEEPVPLEQLVLQLRQMFTGPHERLCEARFEELFDILEEQKSAAEQDVESLQRRIVSLDARVEESHDLLTDVFGDALAAARHELEQKIERNSEALYNVLQEIEASVRDLSAAFASHVADEELRIRQDHQKSLMLVDQRIAQWRDDIESARRGDIEEVGSSMMDIGERLLALKKL